MDAAVPTRPVPLSDRPLSFWLRLAHVHRVTSRSQLQAAPVRILSNFELVLQVEGSNWIWSEADRGSVDIRPDDVVFIPPGFAPSWGNRFGTHIAIHFDLHAQPNIAVPDNISLQPRYVHRHPIPFVPRFELRRQGGQPALTIPLVTPSKSPALWREQLNDLVDLWNRRRRETLQTGIRVAEVLGYAMRDLTVQPRRPDHDAEARIVGLVKVLNSSEGSPLGDRPKVSDLAAHIDMGETTFRTAFVRIMGCGPRRYLEERRIEQAALALVDTDQSIVQVSQEAGDLDPYHFSRVFRRVMGLSPRHYRRKMRTPERVTA
ncbi:MAG TPA: helix-turn-helix transcriptional regulator [Candidatus Dormibacteraeota bacterium]|nr:helix-turn-helix transcriptional regulator [Candidatus Dormibacteraeota bacterium]